MASTELGPVLEVRTDMAGMTRRFDVPVWRVQRDRQSHSRRLLRRTPAHPGGKRDDE